MSGIKIQNGNGVSESFVELDGGKAIYPALGGFAITLSDTVNESKPFRSLQLGDAAAASISVETVSGDTVVFANIQPGQTIPIQGVRVNSTGTTATTLVGLY